MKDIYQIQCDTLTGLRSGAIQYLHSMNNAVRSGVITSYSNIVKGAHDPNVATAVQSVIGRLASENVKIEKSMNVLASAAEEYLSAEQKLSMKASYGSLIIRNWSKMQIGAAKAILAVDLSPREIAELGGFDLLENYQKKACEYTKYDPNMNLFLGYGSIGFIASNWDAAKITFFNFFDIGKGEVASLFTNKDYEYNLKRKTIESLVEDYIDYEKNPLERLLGEKVRNSFKLVKATGKVNESLEKFADMEYYQWDGEEAFVKLSDTKTREFLRELFTLAGDHDSVRILDNLSKVAKTADVMGKTVKYAGWAKEIATPLITDYANHLEALESMKSCNLFGDDALTKRVIDDMITDYSNSSNLVLQAVTKIAAEEGMDYVVEALKTPIGGTTGVSGGLANDSLRISAVGAVLKGIDLTIDVTGIITGENTNTANLQEYFALTGLQNEANNAFVDAYEKLQSGSYTESDVVNFESCFNLNRSVSLRMCKTELSILEFKYGESPSNTEAASDMALLRKQIEQLEGMKVGDTSTWVHSDGTEISSLLHK